MSSPSQGYGTGINLDANNDRILPFQDFTRTADSGQSWISLPSDDDFLTLFSTSVETQGPSSAVFSGSSLLGFVWQGTKFTSNGNFLQSPQSYGARPLIYSPSQSVESIQGVRDGYAIASDFILLDVDNEVEVHGVAVSRNGGQSYLISEIDPAIVGARDVTCGSYPSNQVWFVIATDDSTTLQFDLSAREFVEKIAQTKIPERFLNSSGLAAAEKLLRSAQAKQGETFARVREAMARSRRAATASKSGSVVIRSTDGGASWTQVFSTAFAIKKMHCPTTRDCYAVAEGVRIVQSNDGGNNWRQTYNSNNADESVFDISCATANECYATGGVLSELAGYFLYTQNAGLTWQRIRAPDGVYPSAIDFKQFNGVSTATVVSHSIFLEGGQVWQSP